MSNASSSFSSANIGKEIENMMTNSINMTKNCLILFICVPFLSFWLSFFGHIKIIRFFTMLLNYTYDTISTVSVILILPSTDLTMEQFLLATAKLLANLSLFK